MHSWRSGLTERPAQHDPYPFIPTEAGDLPTLTMGSMAPPLSVFE